MQARNAAEQIVLDFFASLTAGDLDAVRRAFHPEATWTVMARGIPGSGEHRGADIIDTLMRPVQALFAPGSPQVNITSMASTGDLVMIEARGHGKLKDGRDYDNLYATAFEIADGSIRAIREYLDSYYVHTLFNDRR
jgi:ketosteroid isomerase-like protein